MATIKNQEADFRTIQSINIENSNRLSKSTKKELEETANNNNDIVQDAKPKIIIKIPKPFALGYIIIDLSKLLGNLFKGLAAGVISLVLSKIGDNLFEFLQDKLNNGDVSKNDIDAALKKLDINKLIIESENEYNQKLNLNLNLNSQLDITGVDANNPNANKVVDIYSKGNTDRKNIANKNKYTINKRNRKDVLDSDIVNERNSTKNRNIKFVKNPNYGTYLD
jgi:hypothetical protein